MTETATGTAQLRDGRWLRLSGAVNARDLGGLPTLDGRRTVTGVLLRSDNLQDLTAADLSALRDEVGLRTVVDLRTGAELASEGPGPLVAAGLQHRHHSLVPELTVHDPAALDARVLPDRTGMTPVDVYRGYLRDAAAEIVEVVRVLADPAAGPTVFHCAAGKDRTGMVAALVESAVGVTREGVLSDYLDTAERVPQIVERLKASATYAADLKDRPLSGHLPAVETMAAMLDDLDATWGGAAGWLLAHGLTAAELTSLEERLLPQ